MLEEVTGFEQIKRCLNGFHLNSLARQLGYIKRKGKFRAIDLIRVCVFWSGRDSFPSLEQMVALLNRKRVKITKQSLDQRFTPKAVKFIKKVLSEVMRTKFHSGLDLEWANSFKRILVMDSTLGELHKKCREKFPGFGGGASQAAVKVQYCFDLLSGNILKLLLQPGRYNDTGKYLTGVKPKDLCMFDLGYYSLETFERINRAKAFFISRIRFNTNVYQLKGDKLVLVDLQKIIAKMPECSYKELAVYLGQKSKVSLRLILYKLPQAVSAENRRKLKKLRNWKGKGFSDKRSNFCDVNAYITNLDQKQLPAPSARKIYSLRWQIEIVFKCWKSHFKLTEIPNVRTARFECIFYGCLLRIVISTKFFWHIKIKAWNIHRIEISEYKGFNYLKEKIKEMESILLDRGRNLENFIRSLWYLLTQNAVKEVKRGYKTPTNIMEKGA